MKIWTFCIENRRLFKPSVKLAVAVFCLALVGSCSSPTTPTAAAPPPPPPPPTAEAPSLSCRSDVSLGTTSATGRDFHFDAPSVTNGQAPVLVTCNPGSGAAFPIGSTTVTCTATDALSRTAACTFGVTISKIPQISRVRFLAFGDSLTEGEVTVPIRGAGGPGVSSRQVVVPSAAYPTVLARLLQARYSAQAESIVVANYGRGGDKTLLARSRFIDALNVVRPEAVLLLEGANDIARGEDGAASGAASEIRIMAAEARLRGMRVFIATLPPGRPNTSKAIPDILLLDYANRMRAIAASEGAVLVDLYQSMQSGVFTYIGVDGLHPNEAGYAKMAQEFFNAIQATLEIR